MPFNSLPILENKEIATNIWEMTLLFPSHKHTRAGQFVMVRSASSSLVLSRPISVCDVRDQTLHLIYQTVGRGTNELSRLKQGDIVEITGPIGHGFPVDEAKSGPVALVGGGVGVAPLLYTARELARKEIPFDCHLGWRNEPFLVAEFQSLTENVSICTDSGAVGHHGVVCDTLVPSNYSCVYCCGPTPMMKAVTQMCQKENVPVYISLETKMGCGIGGCLTCTCTDHTGHNRRTCMDGPVFRGGEINFDA